MKHDRGSAIALLKQGDEYKKSGHHSKACRCYEGARIEFEKILSSSKEPHKALRDLSFSLARLGNAARASSNFEEAFQQYTQRLAIARRILILTGETPETLRGVILGLEFLARTERQRGNYASAKSLSEQMLVLSLRLEGIAGRTAPVLRDISTGLVMLGDLEKGLGNAEKALQHYRQRVEVVRELMLLNGQTPQALYAYSVSLERLAAHERSCGHYEIARTILEEKLEVSRKILKQVGESPRALRSLYFTLADFCLLERRCGQLDDAYHRAEECLDICNKILAKVGETSTALTSFSRSLGILGALDRARGQLDLAYQRFSERHKVVLKIIAIQGETISSLGIFSNSLNTLGDIERDLGQLARAETLYLQKIEANKKRIVLTGETPTSLRILSIGVGRMGRIEEARENFVAAIAHYEQSLLLKVKIISITGETPLSLRDLSFVRRRLGVLHHRVGRLDLAETHFCAALETARKVTALLGPVPFAMSELVAVLGNLGELKLAQGNLEEACSLTLEAVDCEGHISPQHGSWPSAALEHSIRVLSLVAASALGIDEALAKRTQLWRSLSEHLDLAASEIVTRARPDVARFHALWLKFSLEQAPEHLPILLAAMQGRKLAAMIIEELERRTNGLVPESEIMRRFVSLRAELRQLVLGLDLNAFDEDGISVSGDEPPPESSSKDTRAKRTQDDAAQFRARRAEYDSKLAEYHRVRRELSERPGFGALESSQIDVRKLRSSLGEHQALVLLIDSSNLGAAPSTADAALAPAHALILRSDSEPILVATPALSASRRDMREAVNGSARAVGMRFGGTALTDVEGVPLASAATRHNMRTSWPDQLTHALWEPLVEHLPSVGVVHVVTHGELHILPLQNGVPDGLQVNHYPGLIFYWLQTHKSADNARSAVSAWDSTVYPRQSAIALQVHSPDEGQNPPPIPFVDAEAQALGDLWESVQNPVLLEREQRVPLLHLAGHGNTDRRQDDGVLIRSNLWLGLQELLRSRLHLDVCYLSACLVGRISEDLDGDPLGILSGLFLRGARQIVAPLVPVSDFHAPLLAILFHVALKEGDEEHGQLDAHRALRISKAQLRSGAWPSRAVHLVRYSFLSVVEREISRSLVDATYPDGALTNQLSLWLRPIYSPSEIRKGPYAQAMSRDAAASAQEVVEMLLAARFETLPGNRMSLAQHPRVDQLLRYVCVFGASECRA